jgi:hypothetical protein
MRSSAGIVAGFLFVGLAANCGGNDTNNAATPGGSANSSAGQGGEGNTATIVGGTDGGIPVGGSTMSHAGEPAVLPMAGQGGMPAPTGCTKNADCGDAATCVDTVCKSNDGENCTANADCLNNCIDGVCTPRLDDGGTCTADGDCAHTCIDGACAPVSDLGGDCDVDLGAGGAGAGGAGAGGAQSAGAGAGGANASLPQNPDCKAPLLCVSGKCLAPVGEACTGNVDCADTCINSVCQPRSTIDGTCDENSDCDSAALVCDVATSKCKLDVLQQCGDDNQCASQRCICSDANCAVRTCKKPPANCLCKWSPTDSPTCNVGSSNLNATKEDPQGCVATDGNFCNGGQCVVNNGGGCTNNCAIDTGSGACVPNGTTTCKAGYHATITAACAFSKGVCQGTCRCDLN